MSILNDRSVMPKISSYLNNLLSILGVLDTSVAESTMKSLITAFAMHFEHYLDMCTM